MSDSRNSDSLPDRATGLLGAELVALVLAIVMPLTPGKTGGPLNPARLFAAKPNYLDNVVASFAMVYLLLLILGLDVWTITRPGRSKWHLRGRTDWLAT